MWLPVFMLCVEKDFKNLTYMGIYACDLLKIIIKKTINIKKYVITFSIFKNITK